jgi:hypothetical protein
VGASPSNTETALNEIVKGLGDTADNRPVKESQPIPRSLQDGERTAAANPDRVPRNVSVEDQESDNADDQNPEFIQTCVKAFGEFNTANLLELLKKNSNQASELKNRIRYYRGVFKLTQKKLGKCKEAILAAFGKLEPGMDNFFGESAEDN